MALHRWPVFGRVMVNLTSGDALAGVLIRRRGPLLVLAHAQLHTAGVEPVDLDGEAYVERSKVLFLQSLPPEQE